MTSGPALERLLVFNLATDADDPILGFTTAWLRALAARVGDIDVVTMRAGRLELPANARVHSVGKERGYSEPRRAVEFYRILAGLLRRHRYDGCFAHMMPLFAAMGWPLLRARRTPIILWYAHRATPPTLRVAARVADRVVTSDRRAFRLARPVPEVIGQGIDAELFRPAERGPSGDALTLVAVGRVSPIKRIDLMIEALSHLAPLCPEASPTLRLVGPVLEQDRPYAEELRQRAEALGAAHAVTFVGAARYAELPAHYQEAAVALNLSPGGSFDKAALEAMACGVPLVTTNPSLQELVGRVCPELNPAGDAPEDVARACLVAWKLGPRGRAEVGLRLREIVVAEHGLERLADRLVDILQEEAKRRRRPKGMPGGTSVWRELRRGKSVLRALGNEAMSQRLGSLGGVVVDVGSGPRASYRRFASGDVRWVGLDVDPAVRPDVVADAAGPWPLRSGCADAVVCSWYLYIPADPSGVLHEAARVLRPGGLAFIATPLVYPPNPEPTDHWRFTEQGLRHLLVRAGLTPLEILPLGDRLAAVQYLLSPYIRPRAIATGTAAAAVALDRLLARLPRLARPAPVGYLAVARREGRSGHAR